MHLCIYTNYLLGIQFFMYLFGITTLKYMIIILKLVPLLKTIIKFIFFFLSLNLIERTKHFFYIYFEVITLKNIRICTKTIVYIYVYYY